MSPWGGTQNFGDGGGQVLMGGGQALDGVGSPPILDNPDAAMHKFCACSFYTLSV